MFDEIFWIKYPDRSIKFLSEWLKMLPHRFNKF